MNAELPSYPFKHEGLVLQDGNKAVLCVRHMCGYVTLAASEVPKEWHGNYDADGLQYLNIHGGITYCEVGGGDEEARSAAKKAAYDAAGEIDQSASLDDRCSFYTARRVAVDAARLTVPYDYVTFGFDCAHSGDENNPDLNDAEHVMGLVRQMEDQLRRYAAVLPKWRAADRERRVVMLDEIIASAPTRCELGFGAMIGLLSGGREFGPQETATGTDLTLVEAK